MLRDITKPLFEVYWSENFMLTFIKFIKLSSYVLRYLCKFLSTRNIQNFLLIEASK